MDDQPPRIFQYHANITNEDILALKEENQTLGHHPENVLIKKGNVCQPLIIDKGLGEQQVDPHRLAYEIFRIFNIQQFTKRTAYGIMYGLNPTYVNKQVQQSETVSYFNQWYGILTHKETAHLCASVHDPTEISCRNFNPSDVRQTPTLKTLCKNFIHCELALTYEVTDKTKFVTYHYQPQVIKKLPIPQTLIEELLELYYSCQSHNQFYGFIYQDRELNRRWYFRKGTKLYEELAKLEFAEHMLHRLYTLKGIQTMAVIYAPPYLKKDADRKNNFGQIRERK